MEIDNDVIDASKEFSGKYKLFSFISGESVGVTWVELAKKAKTLPIPQFWTWRPVTGSGPVIVGGMYYGLDNTLFMAGNKTESPFARCIVTSSIEGSKDRMGFISGASPSEYIFHSFCLMKKMPNDITRRRSRVEFGEFNWKIFVKKYPEESAIMEQYRGFFYSHRKPSGI